ncbi:MFS transporter [Gordonia sp. (in: high G+C Gram-positive bacteria)]|uniref:CynX/NimT family MFS transporter n=1 Tax=Gordonia sp. (in: high G+C Gram-positive bacteria) TaxID=84139 RepID=UPI0026285391|nr:MFS transporter [Gordonia sp. (in: high G+C Gram-positive bacteria)]
MTAQLTVDDRRAARRGTAALIVAAVGVLLVAANLRPAVVAVAPLIGDIQHDTGFSGAVAGLLTTLPLMIFGLVAPGAPWLAARFGIERTVFAALLVLIGGILLRWVPGAAPLFAGTVLAAAAIGVCNVVLPGLVRRDFAGHAGLMTGLYSMTVSGGAAAAAAFTVPIDDAVGGDWRLTLAVWAVPVLIAAVVWTPQLSRLSTGRYVRPKPLWRNKIAWAITLLMGSQSFVFYTFAAWLPAYLADLGYSRTQAGAILAAGQLVAVFGSLITPIIAGRFSDQRAIGLLITSLSVAGLAGLLLTGGGTVFWCILFLSGPASTLGLCLLLMVRRSNSTEQTNQVSGMSQTVGYLLAAAGPFLLGAVYDLTGSWHLAFLVIALALASQAWGAAVAGRDVAMTD